MKSEKYGFIKRTHHIQIGAVSDCLQHRLKCFNITHRQNCHIRNRMVQEYIILAHVCVQKIQLKGASTSACEHKHICLNCNTRQNVVVCQASEWFSLKYRLQADSVCSDSDWTEAVFLSSVTGLHCYTCLISACFARIFVLMWTRLSKWIVDLGIKILYIHHWIPNPNVRWSIQSISFQSYVIRQWVPPIAFVWRLWYLFIK